jgi:hypothetical protein
VPAGLHPAISSSWRMQLNESGAGLDPPKLKEASIRGLFFCLKGDIKSIIQEVTNFMSFRLNFHFSRWWIHLGK